MATPELTTLGRYRIERVLGKGAMGVVYEGFDPRLNRRVAIKTILKSHLDDHTARDYSVRFEREAQAVARLNHPNIVQVHDFGEEGEVAYLVMEFIKGRELKSFFDANERFDLKEAVRIMGELCEALEFAHKAGIVHRDVKPGNVMLDSEMRAKLTDFGVARVQDSGASRATQTGAMVGTPAYMSPEQITGRPVDARSDVFSAGIILYQFLTGEMPFAGAGAWTIAKKIMQDEPALPSTIDTAISPMFDAVVAKALAKQPEQRYQSARALGTALKRALEGKGEDGDADRTVVRVPGKPAAGTAAPSGIQAPHDDATAPLGTAAKARPALFKSLLIGAALAATGAVAWFAWKQMQVDSPGRTFRDCDVCPEIGAIAARSFTMGSPESKPGWYDFAGPQHKVTFSRSFAAGKYEVTFDEWDACVRENGCGHNPSDHGWGRGKRPVINVSWNDAKEYVAWLSRKTGKNYRLLTEAEWEYVARAGTATAFSFGDSISPLQANYDASQSYAGSPTGTRLNKTVPVGSYAPNAFGLHDVHGNVSEWVEDCWNPSYAGAPSDGGAWLSGNCALRIRRGGSWGTEPGRVRSAVRSYDTPTQRTFFVGLRVARTN